jgi:DNA-binding LytR/AlgR family response regulator
MVRINLCDILYIEGKGAYLHVITDTTRIMTLLSFKEIESLLPAKRTQTILTIGRISATLSCRN